jgi:hypothetical protein
MLSAVVRLSCARRASVIHAYVAPRHWPGMHHPPEPLQCTWRDSFMSRANSTGVTEKSQIWKKVLAGFISQILIKKIKIEKKFNLL